MSVLYKLCPSYARGNKNFCLVKLIKCLHQEQQELRHLPCIWTSTAWDSPTSQDTSVPAIWRSVPAWGNDSLPKCGHLAPFVRLIHNICAALVDATQMLWIRLIGDLHFSGEAHRGQTRYPLEDIPQCYTAKGSHHSCSPPMNIILFLHRL